MPNSPFKKQKGFTLIELLIVITIIAVLSMIGMTVYSDVQKGARDARRNSDLKAIHDALEIYHNQNGVYPGGVNVYATSGGVDCSHITITPIGDWTTAVGGNSLYAGGAAPMDPINGCSGGNSFYYYYNNPAGTICARNLETKLGAFCVYHQQQ